MHFRTLALLLALVVPVSSALAQDEEGFEGEPEEGDASGEASLGGGAEVDLGGVSGSADDTSYAQRSLTLPVGRLRVDFAPGDRAFLQPSSGLRFVGIKGADMGVQAYIGAGFGIIENLEAGALLLPLTFAPSGADTFGDIGLYGRYQLVQGSTQVAVHLGLQVPTSTEFGLTAALPLRLCLGESAHLNTGIGLSLLNDSAVNDMGELTMAIGLGLPVELAFNVTPAVFLGVGTGLNADLSPNAFKFISIPANLFAGYTLEAGAKMLVDLVVQFGFGGSGFGGQGIGMINVGDSAKAAGVDGFYTDMWTLTLGATLHYDTK
jgi:hypothetical protein